MNLCDNLEEDGAQRNFSRALNDPVICSASSSNQFKYQPGLQPEFPTIKCMVQQYNNVEARYKTFTDNYPIKSIQRRRQIASAGLYATGEGDKVKCPYCLGKLYNWEETDDPFVEHSKHFDRCAFVMAKIEQRVKNNCYDKSIEKKDVNTQDDGKNYASCAGTFHDSGFSEGSFASANSQEHNPPTFPCKGLKKCIKIVQDLGYDTDVIDEAITIAKKRGLTTFKAEKLLDIIYKIESGEIEVEKENCNSEHKLKSDSLLFNSTDNCRVTTDTTKQEEVACAASTPKSKKKSLIQAACNNVTDTKLEILAKEHEKLKCNSMCSHCGKNKSNILFLPCRHMVVCESCSVQMDDCLKCAKKIIGTVKVFMI